MAEVLICQGNVGDFSNFATKRRLVPWFKKSVLSNLLAEMKYFLFFVSVFFNVFSQKKNWRKSAMLFQWVLKIDGWLIVVVQKISHTKSSCRHEILSLFCQCFFCQFLLIEKQKKIGVVFWVRGKSSLTIEGRRKGDDISLEKRDFSASSARHIHCWHNNRYSPLTSWYRGFTFGGLCLVFPPYTSSPPAHLQQKLSLASFPFRFHFRFQSVFHCSFGFKHSGTSAGFSFEGLLVFSQDRCQKPQTADRTRTRTQKERLPSTTRPPRPPARPRPLLSHARFGPAFLASFHSFFLSIFRLYIIDGVAWGKKEEKNDTAREGPNRFRAASVRNCAELCGTPARVHFSFGTALWRYARPTEKNSVYGSPRHV